MTQPLPPFADSSELAPDADTRLAWASGRMRAYCRWHVAPSITSTVTLDADGGRVLMLPTMYLTGVQSVILNPSVFNPSSTTLVEGTDFTWAEAGYLHRARHWRWPIGFRSVTVTFTHGYASIPDELVEVCAAAAARGPIQMAGIAQESAGGVTRVYGGLHGSGGALQASWLASEQEVLDRYRLPLAP